MTVISNLGSNICVDIKYNDMLLNSQGDAVIRHTIDFHLCKYNIELMFSISSIISDYNEQAVVTYSYSSFPLAYGTLSKFFELMNDNELKELQQLWNYLTLYYNGYAVKSSLDDVRFSLQDIFLHIRNFIIAYKADYHIHTGIVYNMMDCNADINELDSTPIAVSINDSKAFIIEDIILYRAMDNIKLYDIKIDSLSKSTSTEKPARVLVLTYSNTLNAKFVPYHCDCVKVDSDYNSISISSNISRVIDSTCLNNKFIDCLQLLLNKLLMPTVPIYLHNRLSISYYHLDMTVQEILSLRCMANNLLIIAYKNDAYYELLINRTTISYKIKFDNITTIKDINEESLEDCICKLLSHLYCLKLDDYEITFTDNQYLAYKQLINLYAINYNLKIANN